MKRFFFRVVVALAFSAVVAGGSVFAQQSLEPLTNDSVIKLVRAGFKEKTVIAIIHSRHNRFDLNAERLIELKHNGVTENIILAMISQDEMSSATGVDWADDGFFGQSPRSARENGNEPQKQEGADIFGSSGSASGESRGRGQNNSNQGETVTTGTATVRIMRPPVEEGGGAVKLEKTPTLNNDSIIKLVDAGFSEGTIVKRIEDSPSDFDLSPPKLAELRKHRVSESVITAMTVAMSDDSSTKAATPAKSREN
jgi:hypothetical protein